MELAIGAITGSGGALVALYLWNRSLRDDKDKLEKQIEKKDNDLKSVSADSLKCITLINSDREGEQRHRRELEKLMTQIESHLGNSNQT